MTRPARSDLVPHGDPAPALDENHVRRLPSTFWYLDDPFRGISELDTRSLRGYGAFDPVAAAEPPTENPRKMLDRRRMTSC